MSSGGRLVLSVGMSGGGRLVLSFGMSGGGRLVLSFGISVNGDIGMGIGGGTGVISWWCGFAEVVCAWNSRMAYPNLCGVDVVMKFSASSLVLHFLCAAYLYPETSFSASSHVSNIPFIAPLRTA